MSAEHKMAPFDKTLLSFWLLYMLFETLIKSLMNSIISQIILNFLITLIKSLMNFIISQILQAKFIEKVFKPNIYSKSESGKKRKCLLAIFTILQNKTKLISKNKLFWFIIFNCKPQYPYLSSIFENGWFIYFFISSIILLRKYSKIFFKHSQA